MWFNSGSVYDHIGRMSIHLEELWYNPDMGRPKKPAITSGILAQRQLPDGRRKIKLNRNERLDLERSRLVEAAVVLFLDTSTGRTWAQVAEDLGVTPQKLRDLTKSEAFELAYDQYFAELGHDPRFKAAQGALLDIVPVSMRELKSIIESTVAKDQDKLKAIKMVFDLVNLSVPPSNQESDRKEIADYLVEHHITTDIPPEYLEALKAHNISRDVIDVEFKPAYDRVDQEQLDLLISEDAGADPQTPAQSLEERLPLARTSKSFSQ